MSTKAQRKAFLDKLEDAPYLQLEKLAADARRWYNKGKHKYEHKWKQAEFDACKVAKAARKRYGALADDLFEDHKRFTHAWLLVEVESLTFNGIAKAAAQFKEIHRIVEKRRKAK